MNPGLAHLQEYPFEKLAALKAGVTPPALAPIIMSIGEPQHEPPALVLRTLQEALSSASTCGLSSYPLTAGTLELRQSIASWLALRYAVSIDAERQVLPVNGTREALFAVAQCFAQGKSDNPPVLMPNPFYQIYEGAAILAGCKPVFMPLDRTTGLSDFESVPDKIWSECNLVYICSPGNPTGAVISREKLEKLIALALRHDFIIASDECYSEIYRETPPPGILEAAKACGNSEFKNCLAFHSLSKRSSLPGMRSGFVAGDAALIERFKLYRTYHGCAMSPLFQKASAVAWSDEEHVVQNRELYRKKFAETSRILKEAPVLDVRVPEGGFYYWLGISGSDEDFARGLFAAQNVTVLPGRYLARPDNLREAIEVARARSTGDANQYHTTPGDGAVRVALVPNFSDCVKAAERIRDYALTLSI